MFHVWDLSNCTDVYFMLAKEKYYLSADNDTTFFKWGSP